MDDLLEARRQSHEFRSSTMHDVVINNNGTMVGEALDETNTQLDIDAVLAKRPGIRTSPLDALSNITMEDVTDVAKAGGRAVLGGVQDAVTGVAGLASDIGGYLDENVGSLGYVRMGPNGFEYTRELPPGEDVMRLDDAFQAGLKNLGIDVPQGDSSAEAIARGLIQFGAGMAAAPVRGASYLSMMARGGFADALFDPEAGNLSTLLREYGLDNAVLEYLDSKVDEDADAAARLEARFKQSLEGAGLGIPIDMVITGFRLAKSNDGLREAIRNKLTTVKDRLTQPGDMPTTSAFGAGAIDEAKPSVAELRKQANIQRFGYDPNDVQVDKVEVPTEQKPGLIAFHGSGADFDEFKLEKIGTGEGAQAFGYGLYFTDKEDIARFYRDSVGAGNEVTYKGKVIQDLDQDFADENNIAHMAGQQKTPEDMQRVVDDEVRRTRNNLSGIEQSIKDFQENPDVYPLKFHGMEISMETAENQREFLQRRLDAALEVQDNIGQIETKPAGRMYQVGLHVKPDELLDYDKPFDEQSALVQEAILKVLNEVNLDDATNLGVDIYSPPYNGRINKNTERMAIKEAQNIMLNNFTVVRFLNDWSVLRGAENSGEELLEKHGVKGIKYRANRGVGARNVPETGEDNYVIFDDRLISIMKKYGIVGPVAITANSVASNNEEQEGI